MCGNLLVENLSFEDCCLLFFGGKNMANRKKVLLAACMLSTLCVSMAIVVAGNVNPFSEFTRAQDNSQVLVLDSSNAPLRGSSGESVVYTTGGGDLTIRYESPSLKENGTEHFTCWGNGSMKNTLPIKGMTSIAVEGTGRFEIRAGRSYDIYDDFTYARFSSYGTATLTIPETADYFCVYAVNGEMHIKTVTINCTCSANEAWADDDDMLVGATHVYHANELISDTAGSAASVRAQRQTSITNGSASALRVWTEVSGAYPWLVMDIPGLDTTKYEYQVDIKLISGPTNIVSSWGLLEDYASTGTTYSVENGTLSLGNWTTIYFSSANIVGTQFVLSLHNSHGPFEMILDNFKIREYSSTSLSSFGLGTETKYDFASKVVMEYKLDDTGYLRMGFGNGSNYVGYLQFFNGDWGEDKTVGGVTIESIDNGFTRATILLEKVNYFSGGYRTALVRGAVKDSFQRVFISGSTTTGGVISKMTIEANASMDLTNFVGQNATKLAANAIDTSTGVSKILCLEYKLATNYIKLYCYGNSSSLYYGTFEFTSSSSGTPYNGVTVTDLDDGFKKVEIVFDSVTRFVNGSDVSKKPAELQWLKFSNTSATGEIRRISLDPVA